MKVWIGMYRIRQYAVITIVQIGFIQRNTAASIQAKLFNG
ncbi:MAG: hypothetical protein ACI8RD_004067 [Bacillariaceae sp.]|jgi:hypothetical protein